LSDAALGGLDIHVSDRISMDAALNQAVQSLIHVAPDSGFQGIMIHRLADKHFKVELSPEVAFGYTEETDHR
jgi:hypothetical protein